MEGRAGTEGRLVGLKGVGRRSREGRSRVVPEGKVAAGTPWGAFAVRLRGVGLSLRRPVQIEHRRLQGGLARIRVLP